MREIKFRAWDSKYKVMMGENSGSKMILHFVDNAYTLVDNSISIMQYTGFKDIEGKEIYEGDILKDEGNYVTEIIWDNDLLRFVCSDLGMDLSDLGECEVIGNIYENPELIEAKQ